MSATTPSQTIGPFFHGGTGWALERHKHFRGSEQHIEIVGRVLDGNQAGVSDALLEIWQPHAHDALIDLRFQRVATDNDGKFSFWMPRPSSATLHANVTLFARGLLRHVLTRVYATPETAQSTLILDNVSPDRSDTLLASAISSMVYRWDVRLQGPQETVFFEF